jgi:hypothetical protein
MGPLGTGKSHRANDGYTGRMGQEAHWTQPTRSTSFRSRRRSIFRRRKFHGSTPEGTDWLANELRLSKGGFMWFWRSHLDPIWNHHIRGPMRLWSIDGGLDQSGERSMVWSATTRHARK